MFTFATSMKWAAVTAALVAAGCLAGPELEDGALAEGSAAITVAASPGRLTQVQRVHHRVVDGAGGTALEVTLIADGVERVRRVGVRASIDGGPWTDVTASRAGVRNAATDVWTATVAPSGGFTTIEYAAWAEEPRAAPRRWDNRGGANYRASARPAVAWAGERWDGDALVVDVDVEDLAYDKACSAIVTTDDWMRAQYTEPGRHVGPTGRAGIERWQVRIAPSSQLVVPLGRAAVIEYALVCGFGDGSVRHWDSNDGANHRVEPATPPVVAWATPFAAALDVEVAADGTVFALSTSDPPTGARPGSRRWMSIYAADGGVRGVVTLPVDAERITYVEDAGLLIAELWAPDGAELRWQAYRADGTLAWDHTGPRAAIVMVDGRGFLVGGGGVARLDAAAPVRRPCADATVSAAGVAACAGADRIQVIDVASGAELASLPTGEPYAISADGQVVVVGRDEPMSSGYLTSLTGYRLDGSVAWERRELALVPDHAWGGPRVIGDCTTHAIGDVLGFADQPSTGEPAVVLLDLVSGEERRRLLIAGGAVQACPGEDGAFHWNPSYMRYGRWSSSVDAHAADAPVVTIDVGLNGRIGGLVAGGRVTYVQRPYIAPTGDTPQPRLVVLDPGGERWSDYLTVAAGELQPVIDAAGDHVVIARGGELVRLDIVARPE